MGKTILWYLLVVLMIAAVIPTIVFRVLGFRVFRKGSGNTIALTFDDGPDPVYTPVLLDLLKLNQIKATFFVVGKRAKHYPELIRRIHAEGHLIGIHNYEHKSNWILSMRGVKAQVESTADAIEHLTGERPVYYRPPWGILNLRDLLILRKYTIVLWSRMAGDWRKRTTKERLKRKLLTKLRGGEVVLLHDCGQTLGADPQAPERMLEALKEFLAEVRPFQFQFVRIDEMAAAHADARRLSYQSLFKRILVYGWMRWEKLFHVFFRVQTLQGQSDFIGLRMTKYSGQTMNLSDGEQLRRGDEVAELHLNNELLYRYGRTSRSSLHLAIRLIREMDNAMPAVARFLLNHPDYAHVKGLYGITMINRGVSQFGFTVTSLPKGVFSWLTKIYLRILLSIIHPEGRQRIRNKTELLVPKVIAISRKELLRRYHPENKSHASAVQPSRVMVDQNPHVFISK